MRIEFNSYFKQSLDQDTYGEKPKKNEKKKSRKDENYRKKENWLNLIVERKKERS